MRVQIHDDGKILGPEAPADYKTRELLTEILHSLEAGSKVQDWVSLEVTAPDQQVHPRRASANTRVEEFLAAFAQGLELPSFDAERNPIDYVLIDQKTEQALDPTVTLAENGVVSGQRLSVRKADLADLSFKVTTADGKLVLAGFPQIRQLQTFCSKS